MPPVRFLRSTTARLALIYLALFGASVMVLLGFLYWSTAGFMSRQTDATIDAEITGLLNRRQGVFRRMAGSTPMADHLGNGC